ncbi:MAG: B-box zinc finger protein [Myxococcales bacterium]
MEPAAAPVEPQAPQQAVCPEHPDRAAVATCTRCGQFVCPGCVAQSEPPLCERCLAKKGIPLLSQPFTFGGALTGAFQLFLPQAGKLAAICAVWAVPVGISNFLFASIEGIPGVFRTYLTLLAAGLISMCAGIACVAAMMAYAEEKPASLTFLLAEGLRAWPRVFGAKFVAGIQIMLWSLALLVPGIIKAVKLTLVTAVAYREPGVDASERSESLVTGSGWEVLGLLVVVQGLALVASTVVTIGLNVLPTISVALALPAQIAMAFVTLLATSLRHAADLSAYYTLRRSRELT